MSRGLDGEEVERRVEHGPTAVTISGKYSGLQPAMTAFTACHQQHRPAGISRVGGDSGEAGGGGSGEEELSGCGVVVDASADGVPEGGEALPFVEEDGAGVEVDAVGCGFEELVVGGAVEATDGGGSLECGGGFADAFGSVDQDGGEAPKSSSSSSSMTRRM